MKPEEPLVHNLVYPPKNMIRHQGRNMPRVAFSQVLKASVENQHQMRGYCPSCRRYQQLNLIRHIQRMPAVFMLNADIQTTDARQIWASSNWLPHEIGVIVDKGQFFCYQDQDLKLHVQRGVFPVQIYELVGVVAEIIDSENKKPHLVSLVNGKSFLYSLLQNLTLRSGSILTRSYAC
jgi:PAB-dependent poly(A)-specific ribonuclease subunit 2